MMVDVIFARDQYGMPRSMSMRPDEFPEVAMAIRFRCNQCGRPFEVRDELAGKTAQCKRCGNRIQIPDVPVEEPEPGPDVDVYGLEDVPSPSSMPEFEPTPGEAKRGWATRPTSDSGPRQAPEPFPNQAAPKVAKSSFFGDGGVKGALGVLLVVAMIGLKIYVRTHRGNRARNPQPQAAPADVAQATEHVIPLDGPISLPGFPDAGPAREIEPGVLLREVQFHHAGPDLIPLPGHTGKLWIYTPAGDHLARSLPCVMIAKTGENVVTGAKLDEGSHRDHLPYTRAGFAVVAFESDGSIADSGEPSDLDLGLAARRFLHARAGLVNAHIALEYALTTLPEIDPTRIAAAGHGTAGTMAIRFAEHEPRLRACVAFAPDLNFDDRFGGPRTAALRRSGIGLFIGRFSPHVGVASLACPLFLFHAQDDRDIPVRDTQKFAATLRSRDKQVTLEIVPSGGHRDSMMQEGIPLAIEWLRKTLEPDPGA